MKGYAVYQAGIATHFVPSDRLEALEDRLASLEFSADQPSTSKKGQRIIASVIEEFVADSDTLKQSKYDYIGEKREVIDRAFDQPRVALIIQELQKAAEEKPQLKEWIDSTIKKLEFVSPTSLAVALEAIREGKELDINEIFERDLRLASVFCVGPQHLLSISISTSN